ncbi:hypothetical protein CFC21_003685 [Triticum aestivum]|uniref:Uncharacterized protein n=2 Tax=Triticum TaxID=4564 RepID=A0A9R0QG99_TRITD|nr:hypothetical protein CFC21_003685 [Triticum aestivum]VAH09883.1 unnamed protein product [Triticum turgidum subsp. durum]
MAGGTRNRRHPKAADHAVAEAVEAPLGGRSPVADPDGVSPAAKGTELPVPEKKVDAEAEAKKLKELNAMLLKEVMPRRGQVATLSARVEELSIASVTEDELDAEKPLDQADETEVAQEAEDVAATVVKPGAEKKVVTKKKAPTSSVQARKAAEAEKISTAAANASADEQAVMAGPAPGGRPRRNRKANSMYPSDTWAR